MNILLIKPTQTGRNLRRQLATYEPLGLEYLSAWIKRSGFKARILDAHIHKREINNLGNGVFRVGASRENIRQMLLKEKPELIGVSCLFKEYSYDGINIINLCRQALPDARIILGGQDAATRPDFYFKHSNFDLIVCGEGELTFEDILRRLSKGEDLSGIPGTIEFRNKAMIKNTGRERIANLNELPFPERELSAYIEPKIQKITYPFAKKLPAAIIQSSRGCLMKCAFCDIISVWNKWTFRTAENIVDEIELLNKKSGIKEFSFIDDNFMLNKERVMGICREIIRRNLDIAFEVNPGISVWTINKEIIELMARAGLYRICLPIESGSQKTLDFIGKPVDLAAAKAMIRYCNSIGLYTYGNILIGFPFEKKEEIDESIKWAFESSLDMVHFLIVEPYSGASMFDIYTENGWLDLQGNEKGDFQPMRFRTKYFDMGKLNDIRNKAQLRYFIKRFMSFLNPVNFAELVWPKINTTRKLAYFLKIAFSMACGTAIPENFAPFKLFIGRKKLLFNYR